MQARPRTLKFAQHLRRNLSLPEGLLWDPLKGRQAGGLKFRRQHPIGSYVLDFFCAERRLAVEIDGQQHTYAVQIEHDRVRDAWLKERGIQVLRVPADHVLENAAAVAELIALEAALPRSEPRTTWWIK
jgi:very-short-patch-repair endonuclease